MGRRCKYDPALVVKTVLGHRLLYRVAEIVFTSDQPLHSVDVARAVGITQGYAYTLLRRLEKWGVLEPVRDPKNGKTAFKPSNKRAARMLSEEIRKREAEAAVMEWELAWENGGED